jgi:hypothetical protein
MVQLDTILKKYSAPVSNGPASALLQEIETLIGFPLPDDYKYFLLNYKGFEHGIGDEYLHLWDLHELIENNEDYLITNNLPQTLGIGDDRGGEFIALEKITDNVHRVVLSPFVHISPQFHLDIGNSFTDFLMRLEAGKSWAI